MNILFTSGFKYLPQVYGGLMSNTHELALQFQEQGHRVSVAAELEGSGVIGLRTRILGRIFGKARARDSIMGYPTYRRWDLQGVLSTLVGHIRPDIAFVQASEHMQTANLIVGLGVPVIVYLHDVLFDELDGDPRELGDVRFVSNSRFTARKYLEKFGITSDVVPPLIRADSYRVKSQKRFVTMINPQPFKGVDLAKKLVRALPDIPFCFVESWELPREERDELEQLSKRCSNFILRKPTLNMKSVYLDSKIVIVPSTLEEAWGRVASEAQVSGIPVVASNIGGLPEAVGPGGILLAPDDFGGWADAIRRLWYDEAHYSRTAEAAMKHSKRAELDPVVQASNLLSIAHSQIEKMRDLTSRKL